MLGHLGKYQMKAKLLLAILCIIFSACPQEMSIFGHLEPYNSLEGKSVARAIPEHTIARGQLQPTNIKPMPKKGQERYDIYCAPCHGLSGFGDGLIINKGFPAPPSFHQKRLRDISDQHIFDVIRNGFGKMYGFSDRIGVSETWNTVAYIRALQLSQNFNIKDVSEDLQRQILRELQ